MKQARKYSLETKYLESQIDKLVYKLYNLTYQEIEIIEQELNKDKKDKKNNKDNKDSKEGEKDEH